MQEKEPIVYLNGKFVPASQASIAIYDYGIVLGATITEMTRTFRHRPFRLDDHLARLHRSCRYTRIGLPFDERGMKEASTHVLEHNCALIGPEQELGLIHFMTPGEVSSYVSTAVKKQRTEPTVCIHTFPLAFHSFNHLFTEGAHVVTPSIRHLPPVCVDSKIKHRSRMHQWLADQETHQIDPRAVTLFLDLNGNISETSGSNFIIARDGTVISPTTRNVLGGVSLMTVKELCAELDIGFEDRELQVYDVVNADEAMLPSTPYCLAPVTKINGSPIGGGEVQGPIFRRLIGAWSGKVGVDIVEQITQASA